MVVISVFVLTQVTTVDGYILSLQRIPSGRSGKKADKPPVLIQHGLFCVSFVLQMQITILLYMQSQHVINLTPMTYIYFRMQQYGCSILQKNH